MNEAKRERDVLAIRVLRNEDPEIVELVKDFSREMLVKLARTHCSGISGWAMEDDETWTIETIKERIFSQADKGHAVDVANYALFFWYQLRRIQKEQERDAEEATDAEEHGPSER